MYPESNGAVERMHGTMKSVLGKCIDEGLDWVEQLGFVMYVLRQVPHSDSGFSPFDLIYGFRVVGLMAGSICCVEESGNGEL